MDERAKQMGDISEIEIKEYVEIKRGQIVKTSKDLGEGAQKEWKREAREQGRGHSLPSSDSDVEQ